MAEHLPAGNRFPDIPDSDTGNQPPHSLQNGRMSWRNVRRVYSYRSNPTPRYGAS